MATQNQISYFRAKEEQRHNQVYERETYRHNLAMERLNYYDTKVKEATSVYATKMNYYGTKYKADKDYDKSRFSTIMNYKSSMSKIRADYNAAMTKINADFNANVFKTKSDFNAKVYAAKMSYYGTRYVADTNKQIAHETNVTKYVTSSYDRDAKIISANKQLEGVKIKAYNDYQKAKIETDAKIWDTNVKYANNERNIDKDKRVAEFKMHGDNYRNDGQMFASIFGSIVGAAAHIIPAL